MTTHPTRRRRFVVRFDRVSHTWQVIDRNRRTVIATVTNPTIARHAATWHNRHA